jgi:hypothetical protein
MSQKKFLFNFYSHFLLMVFSILSANTFIFADSFAYDKRVRISEENDEIIVNHYHDCSKNTDKKRYKMITTHQNPFLSDNDYSYLEAIEKKSGKQLFKKPVPALNKIVIIEESKYIIGLSKIKLWNPFQLLIYDKYGNLVCKKHIAASESELTVSEYKEFEEKFPEVNNYILFNNLILKKYDNIYIDFLCLGIPYRKEDGAFNFLFKREVCNHLSKNFRESVTNYIYWYKEPDPKIKVIYVDKKFEAVSLLDPKGERFEISIEQCQK